jgi:zinc protease
MIPGLPDTFSVVPAQAGTQRRSSQRHWVPAIAGMTNAVPAPDLSGWVLDGQVTIATNMRNAHCRSVNRTRRAMLFGIAACIAVAAHIASAQPFDTPPPVGAPRAPVIAAPEVRTLANGLRVVVAQRRDVPLVTAELVVRSGAEADPAALSGLADLTATLIAKGTTTRTAPQIAEAAEALGGQLQTGAGWDWAFVTITVTRPQLATALALVADVTMRPRFAPSELERARRQAIDGLNVALSLPGTLARLAANRAAFGAGTYGHPASGTPASLARMKRTDVAAFHAAHFRPDNASLVLAGDVDVADALQLAQTAFGGWKRPPRALAPAPVTAADPVLRGPVAISMTGAGQAGVALAAPSIARAAPDYYAGVVGNTLLGNGYSSRLNQEVRIKRGLSYGVVSRLDARRAGGVFGVGVQTKNASAPEVVAVTLAEMARVADAPAPADELEARKLAVIGGVSRSFETTASLAGMIAALEAEGVDVAELTRTIPRLAAVSAAEVQAFARAHWVTGGIRIVVAGEAAEFVDALRAAHPGVVVIPQAEVDLERPALVKAGAKQHASRDVPPSGAQRVR